MENLIENRHEVQEEIELLNKRMLEQVTGGEDPPTTPPPPPPPGDK